MSSPEPRTVLVSGHHKIKAGHLQRLAYIYIRQSTLKQVKENLGSQAYQYQLIERAQALGWPRERIRVIDADQGRSGRQRDGRDGFQEMVAEISLGHVGIVFGYEVSRLARNNLDWYTLLDLAAIFETLMADDDPHAASRTVRVGFQTHRRSIGVNRKLRQFIYAQRPMDIAMAMKT
jgi:hypothetical protein